MSATKVIKGVLLLVDDNQNQREVLTAALSDAGFRCQSVGNCASAINAIEQANFSLTLISHNMKPVNGLETAIYIRDLKTQDEMPIILLSEKWDKDTEKEALICGIDKIVLRETNRNKVIKTVHELLKLPY